MEREALSYVLVFALIGISGISAIVVYAVFKALGLFCEDVGGFPVINKISLAVSITALGIALFTLLTRG